MTDENIQSVEAELGDINAPEIAHPENQDNAVTADAVDEPENTTEPTTEEAPPEPEKITMTQDELNELIGHRAEQAKRTAAREFEERMKQLEQRIPQEARPNVRPYKESYEFDSEAEHQAYLDERDKEIENRVAYDQRQLLTKEQQEAETRRQQEEQVKAFNQKAGDFLQKGNELGLDMVRAGSVLDQNIGPDNSVALFSIVSDMDDGPVVLDYLSRNPSEAIALIGKPMHQVAIHLASKISPKAAASRKPTSAPPPTTQLEGGGAPPVKRGPKGATYKTG